MPLNTCIKCANGKQINITMDQTDVKQIFCTLRIFVSVLPGTAKLVYLVTVGEKGPSPPSVNALIRKL